MILYPDCQPGIFKKRVNRFIAEVEVDGHIHQVHVKNTGRMQELLLPERLCTVQFHNNPTRKTKYSLISILHEGIWVNLDSQVNNAVVTHAFEQGKIQGWEQPDTIKREVKVEDSRLDLLIEQKREKLFVEVKGVNLVENGLALFPDAVTARGVKHLKRLMEIKKEGHHAMCIFLVGREDATSFFPHAERDPLYAQTFCEAKNAGVDMRVYTSKVTKNSITLGKEIPVWKTNEVHRNTKISSHANIGSVL